MIRLFLDEWRNLNGWEKFSIALFLAGPLYMVAASLWVSFR